MPSYPGLNSSPGGWRGTDALLFSAIGTLAERGDRLNADSHVLLKEPISHSPAKHGERIEVLDGLRAVACLAVVGYHYFSRWTPPLNAIDLYPYGATLAATPLFSFGYMGVQLFFLVSGFVITLTLSRCETARDFAIRRIARLFPAMLLAASATFLVVRVMRPHYWTMQACNFLPSLTFTHPYIYRHLFGIDCQFMDGVYWSLFVEVRFYAWSALLYFGVSRTKFLRNAGLLVSVAIAVQLFKPFFPGSALLGLADWIFFPRYAPWLFSGVASYFVWQDRSNRLAWLIVLEGMVANLTYSISDPGGAEWAVVLALYALFTAFALRLGILRIFGGPLLTSIGAASYSLYLLHENIGVTAIGALAAAFGVSGAASIPVAFIVAVALVLASIAIYRLYENPARHLLTRWGNRLLRVDRSAGEVRG